MTLTQLLKAYPVNSFVYRPDTNGCDRTWNIVLAADDSIVTYFSYWSEEYGDRFEVMARLFVSAPDLLHALVAVLETASRGTADQLKAALENAAEVVAHTVSRSQ